MNGDSPYTRCSSFMGIWPMAVPHSSYLSCAHRAVSDVHMAAFFRFHSRDHFFGKWAYLFPVFGPLCSALSDSSSSSSASSSFASPPFPLFPSSSPPHRRARPLAPPFSSSSSSSLRMYPNWYASVCLDRACLQTHDAYFFPANPRKDKFGRRNPAPS